ncbi:MAG TPA: ribbon-helix-helix domain-containing protein [Dehalococcoidia bacterium]|nr:ribbon-helix-helix domain-containing protein [Dehalococcoidia bacterium]
MAKMIRKQVYIEPEQEVMLKRRSRELGVSEAELIRRGIEEVARARVSLFDPKSWEEALEFMKARAKIEVPQTGRTWTRDELYEERLERFSR